MPSASLRGYTFSALRVALKVPGNIAARCRHLDGLYLGPLEGGGHESLRHATAAQRDGNKRVHKIDAPIRTMNIVEVGLSFGMRYHEPVSSGVVVDIHPGNLHAISSRATPADPITTVALRGKAPALDSFVKMDSDSCMWMLVAGPIAVFSTGVLRIRGRKPRRGQMCLPDCS